MSFDPKLLTDKELIDIIRRAPDEIECGDAYGHFMEDLASLVTKHFGGESEGVSAPWDQEDIEQYRCDNCNAVYDVDSEDDEQIIPLDECKNLSERVTPGCPTPDGECPECGAFVYKEKNIHSSWVVRIHHNECVPEGGWVYSAYDPDISWREQQETTQ